MKKTILAAMLLATGAAFVLPADKAQAKDPVYTVTSTNKGLTAGLGVIVGAKNEKSINSSISTGVTGSQAVFQSSDVGGAGVATPTAKVTSTNTGPTVGIGLIGVAENNKSTGSSIGTQTTGASAAAVVTRTSAPAGGVH